MKMNFRLSSSTRAALLVAFLMGTVACADNTLSEQSGAGSAAVERPLPAPGSTNPPANSSSASSSCVQRKLTFSADELPTVPAAGSALVWGGNATGGESAP